jgi:asparagine synthase (glutamine-hydrolysing)
MGQKPLYVTGPNWSAWSANPLAVAFASELGALRGLSWFDGNTSDAALVEYLRWGFIGNEASIYRGAEKVPPATWFRFGGARCRCKYFGPNDRLPAEPDPVARTRRLVTRAVERQLISDVPLGCFLSGGIDSSVVTACMKRVVGDRQPIATFSIGFDDPRYDETRFAAAVARHLGTEHHEFVVRPAAVEDLPRLAVAFGEPFADSSALPTHYLSRETRGVVKVALSGDGGDELFGGYDRYRAMRWAESLRRVPALHTLARGAARAGRGGHPKSFPARAARFASAIHLTAARRYESFTRLFHEASLRELLIDPSHAAKSDPDWLVRRFDELYDQRDVVEAALATDRLYYLSDDLLTKVDRASMLHGLEVRSPFMDHELVAFAAGLTTDQLLKGGPKRMLREAFADDLPAWVFKRKKMGFAVPIGEWFRGELRPMLRDNLFAAAAFGRQHFDMKVVERLVDEHETQRVDHSQRLYALLMLELWWLTAR